MNSQNSFDATIQALFFTDMDIVAAYLFGSHALGKAHKQSDVDVAVLFADHLSTNQVFEHTLAIGTLLETKLATAVDVIAVNRAPPFLRFQVVKTGTLILERDLTQRCLFHMKALRDYYDAKPYIDYQQAVLIQRIRKQGLANGYHDAGDALAKIRKLRQTLTPTTAGDSR